MVEIDTDKLIEAVKRRPALYNKSNHLYYKTQKPKIWMEACRDVFENWELLRPQDRVEYCHDLQKRWKSLRRCFKRELQLQQREKAKQKEDGKPVKRRKRYEYFDMLGFLLDPSPVSDAEEIEVRESDEESYDPLDTMKRENDTETVMEESGYTSNSSQIIVETKHHLPYQKYYNGSENVEEKFRNMLKEIKKEEEDEDRQFMLSLVPSFRKLKKKQKFEAKIEILKVLKTISFEETE